NRLHDVLATQALAVGPTAHRAAYLRRDDHLVAVAAVLHPAADDLLGHAAGIVLRPTGIDVGRIQEVTTGLDERVHDGAGGPFVGRPAPLHGPEAQLRDPQPRPSEPAMFQGCLPLSVTLPRQGER